MRKLSHRCSTAGLTAPGQYQRRTPASAGVTLRQSGRTGQGGPGLGGTGLVADDLYLMAHHEVSGKPFLQPRALGTGLAGGLLAELMLDGGIAWWHDGTVVPGRFLPADALARRVQDQIAAEREPHQVHEWLQFLARTAPADVAARLGRSGYLTLGSGRAPWRPGRWVPVDPDWSFSPMLRVRSALDPDRTWSAYGAALAGLALACGLGFRIAQYAAPASRSPDQLTWQLEPGLQELITQTQMAVDSTVLSHRM
jgi:Golgi phosphoprotein 3 (GPP34)